MMTRGTPSSGNLHHMPYVNLLRVFIQSSAFFSVATRGTVVSGLILFDGRKWILYGEIYAGRIVFLYSNIERDRTNRSLEIRQ